MQTAHPGLQRPEATALTHGIRAPARAGNGRMMTETLLIGTADRDGTLPQSPLQRAVRIVAGIQVRLG